MKATKANKYEDSYMSGYQSALENLGMFLLDNKRMFAPSAYKTFVRKVANYFFWEDKEARNRFIRVLTT